MAEIGADFRGGWYGDQTEASGGGYDPLAAVQTTGPLAKLYNSDKYNFNSRFYPRDLGSEARGHYINFYINVASKTQYMKDYKPVAGAQSVTQGNQSGYVDFKVPLQDVSLSLKRKTTRISDAISLYMPDTMNVSYDASWESSSLTDAGGKLLMAAQGVKSVVDGDKSNSFKTLASNPIVGEAAGEMMGGGDATNFALFAGGTALNPQLEVLFKGTSMRNFQFDFLFAPYSQAEADNVYEIIKTFKFHAMPELLTKGGRYFVPPSEFDIDFLFNGQINNRIHRLATSVLTNVNVDYAPNGWSTLSDGSPVATRMTLQFQEVEIMTKERIKEGY
jgi:hypothetical protein